MRRISYLDRLAARLNPETPRDLPAPPGRADTSSAAVLSDRRGAPAEVLPPALHAPDPLVDPLAMEAATPEETWLAETPSQAHDVPHDRGAPPAVLTLTPPSASEPSAPEVSTPAPLLEPLELAPLPTPAPPFAPDVTRIPDTDRSLNSPTLEAPPAEEAAPPLEGLALMDALMSRIPGVQRALDSLQRSALRAEEDARRSAQASSALHKESLTAAHESAMEGAELLPSLDTMVESVRDRQDALDREAPLILLPERQESADTSADISQSAGAAPQIRIGEIVVELVGEQRPPPAAPRRRTASSPAAPTPPPSVPSKRRFGIGQM
ncbi:MAG: hypothetical protein IPK19_00845 [Chloroflexi bacterium]|nr:hypothetical protein [Chloroflexota bacterium]